MMLTGQPFISTMVDSFPESDLTSALTATIVRIARLDHFEWTDQLASDGFTQREIERLSNLVPSLLDGAELKHRLAAAIAGIHDLQDEEQMNSVVRSWLTQEDLADTCRQVCNAGFADPIDALASVVRYLLAVAASTLALEAIQRTPLEQGDADPKIEPYEVAQRVELAEEGLQRDMAEWPVY